MTVSTYNWVWTQINKSIESIENELSKVKLNGENAVDVMHFRRTYGVETQDVIKDEYIRIRDRIKSQCYENVNDENGEENRIDHHKIAACFCKALIQKKVFSFALRDNTPSEMILSNYELAYTVSLRIVYFYLIELYKDNGHSDIAERLIEQRTLKVPLTSYSHDEYNLGRVKTLALNDFYGIELDILTYADMMYWIEYYNRQLLEQKVVIEPWDMK